MKKVIFSWLLSAMFISTALAQFGATRTGFEGDNFSLEGALELFENSRSIQDFERRLNTRTNWVNNLDLDYNGRTDYIRVNQRRQGRLNAIVLQVPVDRRYVQDVAVIQIEQTGRRSAILQMVGDADLYGQNVVIEPFGIYDDVVNVYRWRAVRDILDGNNRIYASPYAFNNYPQWYNPWNQYAWNVYQPRISNFGRFYRVSPFNRLANVYNIYSPYRAYCPAVRQRTVVIRDRGTVFNRATVQRNDSNRNNRVVATPRTTRTTTRSSNAAVRATRNNATTRATRQAQATRSRATTSTKRTATPSTRSRATVNRSTATRSSATQRTSRPSVTRATSQSRSNATANRRTTSVQRQTVTPSRSRSTATRSTSTQRAKSPRRQ